LIEHDKRFGKEFKINEENKKRITSYLMWERIPPVYDWW
jgi:hypothetical protein